MNTCQNCGKQGDDVHLRYFGKDAQGHILERWLCDERALCRLREMNQIKEKALSWKS